MLRNLSLRRLPRAATGWLWAGIVLLLLGGCGGLQTDLPPDPPAPAAYAYVATVDVSDADTPASIAARFDADVVTWLPQAGFAVLGLRERPTDMVLLSTLDANEDVVLIVEDEAEAAGVSAWAGGVSAWAGGVSAWAGGVSAWAGGTANPFPGNDGAWQQIRLGQAQDLATGRGQGIVVAVIDTGVDLLHSGLQGRLAPAATWLDLVDKDTYPHEGYAVVGDQLQPTASGAFFGHGTAAAGIVLQAAPRATILPIRVLKANGKGNASDIVQGIDHAIRNGAAVINLSLGTLKPVAAIEAMVAYANSLGVVVVASSGNSGDTRITYPAASATDPVFVHAIGVGSVDADDRKSPFSTYGTNLEMVAPGSGITTLFPGEATAVVSGTSFAAPWVAGVAALARGQGASAPASRIVDTSASIDAVNPSFAGLLGSGRLDALAALTAALGTP